MWESLRSIRFIALMLLIQLMYRTTILLRRMNYQATTSTKAYQVGFATTSLQLRSKRRKGFVARENRDAAGHGVSER